MDDVSRRGFLGALAALCFWRRLPDTTFPQCKSCYDRKILWLGPDGEPLPGNVEAIPGHAIYGMPCQACSAACTGDEWERANNREVMRLQALGSKNVLSLQTLIPWRKNWPQSQVQRLGH